MAVSQNKAVTPQAIKTACAILTAAKTTLNDGTNAVAVFTAGANGAIVYGATAVPRATVTATRLDLYRYDGATYHLVDTVLMAAHTVANTTAIPVTVFSRITETSPLRVKAGDILYASAAVALAGGIVVDVQYEEL